VVLQAMGASAREGRAGAAGIKIDSGRRDEVLVFVTFSVPWMEPVCHL
jgi:hypothetical protein